MFNKPWARIKQLFLNNVEVTATALEINNACDVSANTQILTVAGANTVTPGVKNLELDNDTTAITATIADAAAHPGFFHVKATSEPGGGEDHTVTLTSGTWNGTNNVATFADILDALVVYFDSEGNGSIVLNVGTVTFS